MRIIKLMADYQCHPLWEASPSLVGNINPASLPISQDLINRLNEWAQRYDMTLNLDDPTKSGFVSVGDKDSFKEEGNSLAVKLQDELGAGYLIKSRI
jgi:hypothetical protein